MGKKQFVIQFGGLSIGAHEYEFEVNDTFFDRFEFSEIKKANILVKVELLKQSTVMTLNFDISGTIGIECDRCTGDFTIPLEAKDSLVVKHGDRDETNDEILVLAHGDTEMDISQPLYEFIVLALPGKKIPCEMSPDYKCDQETLNKLKGISVETPEENKNPLWDKLKNINFNN
jgi:uncharacterized protein